MFVFPAQIRDLVILIARLGIGLIFFAHGWQKLFTVGLGPTAAGFKATGVPLPTLSAWYAGIVEFFGGALLILGLAVPIAGVLLFLDMLGAFFTVHVGHGLFVNSGGSELVIALGVGSLLLAAVGAGLYSIDHAIAANRATTPHGPKTIP
ncbi:DoxX family protein [Catellatospora citrea]|uniref:DoxX family protein n=1 Tax=Catellatospora citrea TaxID=53366 RepID=UPI0033CEB52A